MLLLRIPLPLLARRPPLPLPLPRRHIHLTLPLATPRAFLLADIGEGITECEILKWHVLPQQQVQTFDPLCEVQSDKASVEITSPWEGRVVELCVKEGGVVRVGGRLCVLDVEGGEAGIGHEETSQKEHVKVYAPEPFSPAPALEPAPAPAPAPAPTPPPQARRPHPLDPSNPPPSRASPAAAAPVPDKDSTTLALPSVRHYARSLSVPLSLVPGSGKTGRITREDVDKYLSLQAPAAGTGTGSFAGPQGSGLEIDTPVELGRTRYAMFRSMTLSLQIPHFGYSAQLDLTALSHLLPQLNAHIPAQYLPPAPLPSQPASVCPGAIYKTPPPAVQGDPLEQYSKLTFLPLLLKALAGAMLEWPLFRSTLQPSSGAAGGESAARPSLLVRPHADISLALSTPTGLYTPTLFSVDTLSPYALAGRIARLTRLGRQVPSALSPPDFGRGGTLAVSNIGALGSGTVAHPLLVPGIGLAIVVLGRAKWVDEVDPSGGEFGEVRRRLKMDVSWAGDHRVVEGAEIAAFVEAWRGWVESPGRMIGAGR
ncbi:CoA-dependent acyltransferase [Calocera viscosa TUFC12733]|uniref:Dihydrolipoamide acetyltransferase component of pyruvate dehydrogenase complex n=1 Tax=Calocera viscosa (strain TUFC12733) TaxID=1330018 RepID=A0A167HWA3_CALVF|nr:CoA-dependent acyltransferase [Calocera viscosa TUFC12733]